jgi:hypothetical protein
MIGVGTKSDKVESQINLHFSYQKNRTTEQNLYIGNYWNAGVLNLFDMLITTISHVYYETAAGSAVCWFVLHAGVLEHLTVES